MHALSLTLPVSGLALVVASAATADDVVVDLGSGDDFVVHGGTIRVDPLEEVPAVSKPPGLWLSKGSNDSPALIMEKGSATKGVLACIGSVDSSDGFAGDNCGLIIRNGGMIRTNLSLSVEGYVSYQLNPDGIVQTIRAEGYQKPPYMISAQSDVAGPAMVAQASN